MLSTPYANSSIGRQIRRLSTGAQQVCHEREKMGDHVMKQYLSLTGESTGNAHTLGWWCEGRRNQREWSSYAKKACTWWWWSRRLHGRKGIYVSFHHHHLLPHKPPALQWVSLDHCHQFCCCEAEKRSGEWKPLWVRVESGIGNITKRSTNIPFYG